jgi:hypothetical protein
MLSQKREGKGVFKLLLVEREKLREVERKTKQRGDVSTETRKP